MHINLCNFRWIRGESRLENINIANMCFENLNWTSKSCQISFTFCLSFTWNFSLYKIDSLFWKENWQNIYEEEAKLHRLKKKHNKCDNGTKAEKDRRNLFANFHVWRWWKSIACSAALSLPLSSALPLFLSVNLCSSWPARRCWDSNMDMVSEPCCVWKHEMKIIPQIKKTRK